MNARSFAVAVAVVVLGLVALSTLADATLTTHVPTEPGSRTEIVVHATTVEEGEFDLAHGVESLVRFCQLEVGRDIGPAPLASLGGDRFGFAFHPALDDADQDQFRGCVGDIVIDHLQASVESMTERAPEGSASAPRPFGAISKPGPAR